MKPKIASRLSIVVGMLIALCVASPMQARKTKIIWAISEHPLATKHGGRANTIAVHPHPALQDHMLVASETGGLFRTENGGRKWEHVDELPVIFTQSVTYLPQNPGVVLVTAKADFKKKNGGGVWRSADVGNHIWTQADLIPGFTGRMSAYEISVAPNTGTIAVGTSEGLFLSFDQGLSWRQENPFGGAADKSVISVLAVEGRIYAGGPAGVRVATGNFTTWTAPANGPGTVRDMHAFGRSPLSTAQAFVVNSATQLFFTTNGGTSWTNVAAPTSNGGCGGIAFIKTAKRTISNTFVDMYYGNRCWMHRFIAPVLPNNVPLFPDEASDWDPFTIDHGGTRDLALSGVVPVLLATNGGVHNTEHGMVWNLVGGQHDGYNALQINEVKGQIIREPGPANLPQIPVVDLYIGTQDNRIWATTINGAPHNSLFDQGHFIELQRSVKKATDSKLNYVRCGSCANQTAGHHLEGESAWLNPPGAAGAPALIGPSRLVQQVSMTNLLQPGLAVTQSGGTSWRQFALYTEQPRDLPKLAASGGFEPNAFDIVYQSYRTNVLGPAWSAAGRLMRIRKRVGSQDPGEVSFPAMNGFGALGINPTMFPWHQVYGVDPGHPDHIIAPDVVTQREVNGERLDGQMMETTNGGMDWHAMTDLTDKVTKSGELLFRTDIIRNGTGPVFPIVTAVSFCPVDPNLVLVGTSEGGIFYSNDNGATWRKIENSEKATYITSFSWISRSTVFISTFGRGLWMLANREITVADSFGDVCPGCQVQANKGSSGDFSGGVVVHDGSVVGVRTSNGQLREVFVTPASSVMFLGDLEDPQDDIVITEADGRNTSQLEPLPKAPDGSAVRGVVFAKDDILTGTVFGDPDGTMLQPLPEETYKGPTESPVRGRPYIRLLASDLAGITTVTPNEEFDLAATDFLAGASYELLIDGVPMKGTVTADGGGSFTARIAAPEEGGYHRVEVRAGKEKQVIDASEFLVTDGR